MMIASERFEKIVQLVNEQGIVGTRELAQLLAVTETTIRRDTEELERQGKLIRVHGGAKRIGQRQILSSRDEKSMADRVENEAAKDLVCQKAASFVNSGDCIFLDGGTSIAPMVRYLAGKNVKIVTHSLLVAGAFKDRDSELFTLGGKVIPEYSMTVGAVALDNLAHFNFDYAFLGCAGVDLERQMVYTAEMETMAIKQKAMELAVKNYLLVDASKLQVRGFYSFSPTAAFDALICNDDSSIDREILPDNAILLEQK